MAKKKEIAFDRIPVTPEIKHRLKIYAVMKKMTYDEAIEYLLNEKEK